MIVRMHGAGVDEKRHYAVTEAEKKGIRNQLGLEQEAFICLCVGELNVNKNQSFLISLVPKLIKKIDNFKLILAGNGAQKETLERQICSLGIEKYVELVGYQPKIERYIRASDLVLSASKREGLPFNIVEAMLTKRPVVVSENRGHKELIKSGETGFIAKTEMEFLDKIMLLYNQLEIYNQIAENAYQYAQNYTLQSTINEFIQILI